MSTRVNESVVHWHQVDPRELEEILQSSDGGLSSEEARRRFEHDTARNLLENEQVKRAYLGI